MKNSQSKIKRRLNTQIMKLYDNPLFRIMLILITVWVIGAVGIMFLEGKYQSDFGNLIDTLWWTIVTMTTVGYGDMSPMGTYSRIFAIFIMLTGIGIIALFTGTISSIYVTRKIREGRGLATIKITDHIIICGYNPNLEMILDFIAKLSDNELSVVLINVLHDDEVNSILSRYNKMDIKYVRGDYTQEGILEKANVKNASSAVVLTDQSKGTDDQKTILATLTIKNLNPDLRVIAQVTNRDNITHLRRANVDEIIINDKFETFMTASHILSPGVPQAIYQLIDSQSSHQFQSQAIPVKFIGKSFDELSNRLREDTGCICVGLYTEEEKLGMADFLSADTSSLDAFIERKLKEAGHSMKHENKVSILMNPKSDHIIKKDERVIIIP